MSMAQRAALHAWCIRDRRLRSACAPKSKLRTKIARGTIQIAVNCQRRPQQQKLDRPGQTNWAVLPHPVEAVDLSAALCTPMKTQPWTAAAKVMRSE